MKFYVFTWLEKSYMHLEGVHNFLKKSDFELEEIVNKKDLVKAEFKSWGEFSPTFYQDSEGLAWLEGEIEVKKIGKAKKEFFELLDRIIQGYIPIRHSLMEGREFPYILNYLYFFKDKKKAEKFNKGKEFSVFHEDDFTVYQKQPEIYMTSEIKADMKGDIQEFETIIQAEEEPKDLIEHLMFYNLWELMLKEHMNLAVSKRKKVLEISKKMQTMTLEEMGEADGKISDIIKDIAEVNEKTAQTWQCFRRKRAKNEDKFIKELYDIAEADGKYYDAHMDRVRTYLDHVENLIDIRHSLQQSMESRKLEGIMGIEAASVIVSLLVSLMVTSGIKIEPSWLKLLLVALVWPIIYFAARGTFRRLFTRPK